MRNSAELQIQETQNQEQVKNTVRVIKMIFLAALVVTTLEFYLAYTMGASQILSAARLLAVFIASVIVSWLIARSGRPVLGLTIVFVMMVSVWAISSAFFIANIGFGLALSLALIIPLMSGQSSLTKAQNAAAIAWSFIGSFIVLMAELFGLPNRLIVPVLETFLPIATITMGIAYAFYIFRQFPRFSIRLKFIVSAVTLVTMTVIALTFVISRNTQDIILDETGTRLETVSSAHGLLIGEVMGRQVNSLLTLSDNTGIQETVEDINNSYEASDIDIQEQIEEFEAVWQSAEETDPLPQSRLENLAAEELLEFQEVDNSNVNILVTDRYGGVVGMTGMVDQYDHSEELWWQTAFNNGFGRTYISFLEIDQGSDLFQISIALPVVNEDTEEVVGVLRSVYSLRELSDILFSAQQELGESTRVDLFVTPNILIDIGAAEVEEILSAEELVALQLNLNENFGQFEFENELSLVSQSRVNTLLHFPEVEALGWRIITHQPLNDALLPVREQQRTFIIIGILVLVLASAAAAFLGQNLARPIINLTEAAVQVSEGDLAIQARVETDDELGTLARSFNVMTARLRQTVALQDQRISERTRALEVSAEVSRRLSTILNEKELITEMVQQVQTAFNYYHAHIYLFDAAGKNLVMIGGTGEAGRRMLEVGHKIPKGMGLVGRAAETKMAILAQDVSESPGWLPNPLLPETVSEVAVPILAGDEALGVLDVQHNVRFVLRQEDADLLQSIANQVAIALQNAGAYRRAQRQAQREALINEIGQKIQNTTTVDMALKTAVREIGQAVSASQTVIKLKNGSTNGQQPEAKKSQFKQDLQ